MLGTEIAIIGTGSFRRVRINSEKRLFTFVMSARLSARLPLDRSAWNLILGTFTNIWQETPNFVTIEKKIFRTLYTCFISLAAKYLGQQYKQYAMFYFYDNNGHAKAPKCDIHTYIHTRSNTKKNETVSVTISVWQIQQINYDRLQSSSLLS
jgi:hypothetical protein